DDADRALQRRELVQLVEDQVRVGVALEVDDEAHRLALALAALVLDLADALDALVLDEPADLLGEAVVRLPVGPLADDDLAGPPLRDALGAGAERDVALAGRVAVHDPLLAADDAAGREVRPLDDALLDQRLRRDARLVDDADRGAADLAQVVRRDVGRHADG